MAVPVPGATVVVACGVRRWDAVVVMMATMVL